MFPDFYFEYIQTIMSLTTKQEKELMEKINLGDRQAMKPLIEEHLPSLVRLAKRYSTPSCSLAELIDYGHLILCEYLNHVISNKPPMNLKAYVQRNLTSRFIHYVGQKEKPDELWEEHLPYGVTLQITDPFEGLFLEERDNMIEKALHTLTEREEAIIRFRFGFDGDCLTLEKTGKIFGVSIDRVRQIEAKAFRKLKKPSLSLPLKIFYADYAGPFEHKPEKPDEPEHDLLYINPIEPWIEEITGSTLKRKYTLQKDGIVFTIDYDRVKIDISGKDSVGSDFLFWFYRDVNYKHLTRKSRTFTQYHSKQQLSFHANWKGQKSRILGWMNKILTTSFVKEIPKAPSFDHSPLWISSTINNQMIFTMEKSNISYRLFLTLKKNGYVLDLEAEDEFGKDFLFWLYRKKVYLQEERNGREFPKSKSLAITHHFAFSLKSAQKLLAQWMHKFEQVTLT